MMIDVRRDMSALMPSIASRYEMPSDGTSVTLSWNWKPAIARSYAKYTQSDASSEIEAAASDSSRTSSGCLRAKNMTRSAATNGAQVITERMGTPFMSVTSAPRPAAEEDRRRDRTHNPERGLSEST